MKIRNVSSVFVVCKFAVNFEILLTFCFVCMMFLFTFRACSASTRGLS